MLDKSKILQISRKYGGGTLVHHARIITYVEGKKPKLVSLLTNDMESEIELLFKQIK